MEVTQLPIRIPNQILQSPLSLPEPRLNQVFLRLNEQNIDFNPILNQTENTLEYQV